MESRPGQVILGNQALWAEDLLQLWAAIGKINLPARQALAGRLNSSRISTVAKIKSGKRLTAYFLPLITEGMATG
jgi:hypothetical protein